MGVNKSFPVRGVVVPLLSLGPECHSAMPPPVPRTSPLEPYLLPALQSSWLCFQNKPRLFWPAPTERSTSLQAHALPCGLDAVLSAPRMPRAPSKYPFLGPHLVSPPLFLSILSFTASYFHSFSCCLCGSHSGVICHL